MVSSSKPHSSTNASATRGRRGLTIESLKLTVFTAPQLKVRRPAQLTTSEQFVEHITKELLAPGSTGKDLVRTSLEVAYDSARHDIFLPQTKFTEAAQVAHAEEHVWFQHTIVARVVHEMTHQADVEPFAAMISAFIAYGVDFSASTSGPELASLPFALWCMHTSCLMVFTRFIVSSAGSSQVGQYMRRSAWQRISQNMRTMLALLQFFAQEDGAADGRLSPTADAATRGESKFSSYTTRDFISIFSTPLTWDLPLSTTSPNISSSGSLLELNIAKIFIRVVGSFIKDMSDMDIRWNLRDGTNAQEARDILSVYIADSSKGELLRVAVQYCKDFPILCYLAKSGLENPFQFDQLIQFLLSNPAIFENSKYKLWTEGKQGEIHDSVELEGFAKINKDTPVQPFSAENPLGVAQHDFTFSSSLTTPLTSSGNNTEIMLVGLRNAGNTCFINSFTQLFFAARRFRMALMREMTPRITAIAQSVISRSSTGDSQGDSEPVEFVTVVLFLLLGNMHWRLRHGYCGTVINTEFFRRHLPHPFNDGRQHDASEYAKVLLELLDRTGNEPTPPRSGELSNAEEENTGESTSEIKKPSVVAQWLGGNFVFSIECLRCHTVRRRLTPFWDISVPLRREESPFEEHPTPITPAASEGNDNGFGGKEEHVIRSSDGRVAVTTYGDDENEELPPPREQRASITLSLQKLVFNVLHYRMEGELLQGENGTYCETCQSRERTVLRTAVHATRRSTTNDDDNNNNDNDNNDDRDVYCNDNQNHSDRDEETGGEDADVEENHDTTHHNARRDLQRETLLDAASPLEVDLSDATVEGVPHYLTLQLNRFQYSRMAGHYEKVMDAVEIEETLFLPVRIIASPDADARGVELEESEEALGYSSLRYRLLAVLVHSGPSPRSGHYFTLLRMPGDTARGWALANDSTVSGLDEATRRRVLSGAGGVFHQSETPYIILYERCTPHGTDTEIEEPDDIVFPEAIERLFAEQLRKTTGTPSSVAGGNENERRDGNGRHDGTNLDDSPALDPDLSGYSGGGCNIF